MIAVIWRGKVYYSLVINQVPTIPLRILISFDSLTFLQGFVHPQTGKYWYNDIGLRLRKQTLSPLFGGNMCFSSFNPLMRKNWFEIHGLFLNILEFSSKIESKLTDIVIDKSTHAIPPVSIMELRNALYYQTYVYLPDQRGAGHA